MGNRTDAASLTRELRPEAVGVEAPEARLAAGLDQVDAVRLKLRAGHGEVRLALRGADRVVSEAEPLLRLG